VRQILTARGMNPERFRQVYELYHAALERQPAERAELLAQTDPELRREVESLLGQQGGGLLDHPAWEGAASLLSDPTRTQFSPGMQLGPYRIEGPLGSGGMGEVYRALDTRLDRKVAIKVSAREFSGRFEREARAISALNHAHICTLYDIGPNYLVMEFVEGQTLAARLNKGPLPVELVLRYGAEITDALAEAHSRGIIHRDLKPANVMLTKGGVKVLDFGLAKFTQPDSSEVKRDEIETASHVVMGTPAYMAPEQALGKELDERADLFSFGVVLYEMATGTRPFQGDTPPAMIDAILHQVPARPAQVNPSLPAGLSQIIERALEKDLEVRYQTASGIRADLKRLIRDMGSGVVASAPLAIVAPGRRRSYIVAWVVILTAVSAGLIWWTTRTLRSRPQPALIQLTTDAGLAIDPALSPDGKMVAYASDRSGDGNLDIWVRQVGGGEPIRLTQGPANKNEPSFSPDGTKIVFHSERDGAGAYVVSALGGRARKIAPDGLGPKFSPDGSQIAYWSGEIGGGAGFSIRDQNEIFVVSSEGGVPKRLRPDFLGAAYPSWAPDGKHLLFLGNRDEKLPAEESIDWWVTPLDQNPAIPTGAFRAMREDKLTGPFLVYPWALIGPTWQPDGDSLIFSAHSGDSRNLWRIAISPKTWKASSRPQRLTSSSAIEEGPSVAVGGGGSVKVAFASLSENTNVWSLPLDGNAGVVTGEPHQLTRDSGRDFHPSLSADGREMVFVSDRSGAQEIWMRNLKTGEDSMLTASRVEKFEPHFSPDGTKVSFSAVPNWDVYLVSTNGGAAETICRRCGEMTGWSPDGRYLIGNPLEGQLILAEVASRRRIDLLALSRRWFAGGSFSPDGRWITFQDVTKGWERIAPFQGETPAPESVWTSVSSELREWSPDGTVVYGRSDHDGFNCIWAQRLDRATKHPVGPLLPIFHAHRARLGIDGCSVGKKMIVFSMTERISNIWMAELDNQK
jgi:Tol biopolymer transport system component